jgi:hypothetical protein
MDGSGSSNFVIKYVGFTVVSDDEDRSLLRFNFVLLGESFLAIGRIVLPPSSGSSRSPRNPLTMKMKALDSFETSEITHPTIRQHIESSETPL